MTTSREIDHAPWSIRPTADDLARLRAEINSGEFGRETKREHGKTSPVGLMMFGMVGGFLGLIFGIMALVSWARGDHENATMGLVATLIVAAIGGLCGWGAHRSQRRHQAYMWQLVAFARANSLEVVPQAKPRRLPGSIFVAGVRSSTSEKVSWTVDGHHVETALHTRTSGGRAANSFQGRYLAVRLDEDAPRLTFTAARGPARGAVIAGPEQRVTSAGGKGATGTLTTLPGHAEAARAFMNEEIVALLTDTEHPCNVEVRDGWFFAYYRGTTTVSPPHWQHMFAVADALARVPSTPRS